MMPPWSGTAGITGHGGGHGFGHAHLRLLSDMELEWTRDEFRYDMVVENHACVQRRTPSHNDLSMDPERDISARL
jgi:hypothetical protein